MTATEVEQMVARFTGDASGYAAMIEEAKAATKDAVTTIESAGQKIESNTKNYLTGWATSLKQFMLNSLSVATGIGIANIVKDVQEKLSSINLGDFTYISAAWDAVKKDGEAAWKYIQDRIKEFVTWLSPIGTEIVLLFRNTFGAVKETAQEVWTFITDSYGVIVALLSGDDIEFGMSLNEEDWNIETFKGFQLGLENVISTFSKMREYAISTIRIIETVFINLNSVVASFFASFNMGMGMGAATALTDLKNVLVDVYQNVVTLVQESGVLEYAMSLVGTALGSIAVTATAAYSAFKVAFDVLSGAVDYLMSVLPSLTSVADSSVGYIASTFSYLGEQVRNAGFYVAATVGPVLAAVAAYKLYGVTVAIISATLSFFKVQQLASLAVWVLWQGTVLAANAVLWIYNTTLFVLNGSYLANIAAQISWIATVGLAKLATWLLNGALAAMNLLLAPATMVAAAIAIGFITAAFVVVYSAVSAVVTAGQALMGFLKGIPTEAGPLQVIGDIFKEWGDILGYVFRAAKIDMDLTWTLLATGAELAISQITDLWPPLWDFIRDGWAILTDLVSKEFTRGFKTAMSESMDAIANSIPQWLTYINPALGALKEGMKLSSKDIAAGTAEAGVAAEEAQAKLDKLTATFTGAYKESDRTKALKEDIEFLKMWTEGMEELGITMDRTLPAKAQEAGAAIGFGLVNGFKSAQFDSVLVNSVEAFRRVAAQMDILTEAAPTERKKKEDAKKVTEVVLARYDGEVTDYEKGIEQYFKQLVDLTKILVEKAGEETLEVEEFSF